MATRPIFPGTIKNAAIEMDNADGTTILDLVTAGTGGARIDKISVVSDDTAAVQLDFYYYDGATSFRLGTITIPIGAGTVAGTPSVSVLNQTDMPFLADDLAFYLEAGDKLRVAAQSAITSAKVVHLVVQYGDY